jgi:hypothetical protein
MRESIIRARVGGFIAFIEKEGVEEIPSLVFYLFYLLDVWDTQYVLVLMSSSKTVCSCIKHYVIFTLLFRHLWG